MNTPFAIGIIESRQDPLKLGRYQVRVFGVHSESTVDVPTASLPWAVPLSNYASVSGIGLAPNYVEGSLVFVFFSDGDSMQQPIILGSAAGVPMSKNALDKTGIQDSSISISIATGADQTSNQTSSTVAPTTSGTLSDTYGNPVTDSSGKPIQAGTIDTNQLLKDTLGKKESSNNYKAINQLGYIGKYQMGAAMLTDLGYVVKGTKNKDLTNNSVWTGKNGITSRDAWLNSPSIQESAMDAELVMNEKRLKKLGVIDDTTTAQEKSGYLATSHLLGTGGARDMKKGIVKQDANGVTGNTYYKLGYSAVSGTEPKIVPQATVPENPARETSVVDSVGSTIKQESFDLVGVGFSDPNKVYPKYINEQDINRLARNQNIDKTIVPQKEETLTKGVPIANGKGTWDQSPVPYNATYPYNHVLETESGHIMEFDDTPNNERIHMYHSAGTFTEIDRNGTQVRKIIGDTYEIWERNGYVLVKGNCNITIEGSANVMVGSDCDLEVAGDFNARIGGNVNWSVGGDMKIKTGGNNHSSVGGSFAVDAANKVYLNSGVSSAGGLSSTSGKGEVPNFGSLTLEGRSFEALTEFEDDTLTSAESDTRNKELQDAGLVDINPTPATVDETKSEKIESQPKNDTPMDCTDFQTGNIDLNVYVSPNYRLKDLTKGRKIVSQGGLTDVQIACNLKNLAMNVLETIKQNYPDMIITSGFREPGSNSRSQHPLGMAADMQFTAHKSSEYIDIVKKIGTLVNTDQLILEYRTNKRNNGIPTTWVHVSYTKQGQRNQVFTMDNDKRISDFGQLKLVT